MTRSLADFAGRWQLGRVIEDFRNDRTGRLEGTAVLAPRPGGLRYDEYGALHYGGGPVLAASQCYLWSRAGAGGIDVAFADGRPFHRIAPERARCRARHDCAPDTYQVSYDFTRWPRWRAVWTVTGPRKDYRTTTDYTPAR